MLLSITTTHRPATDLGYLLHKHPDKVQSFNLSVGKAHVFYPEATEEKTTACLLLDIDPIDMVRSARKLSGESFALGHFINDRPYVASSFLSVAIAKVYSSALNGNCTFRPELVEQAFPLEVTVAVVPASRGGEPLIRSFFEPLGYAVEVTPHILDPKFPEWGQSKYFTLRLTHTLPVHALLSHLYVLLPALDNDKHYYVSEEEIKKLVEKGGDWIKTHPQKPEIVRRYLIHIHSFSRQALAQLELELPEEGEEGTEAPEVKERKESLHQKRLAAVMEKLVDSGAKRVLDLGCGEGKLLRMLLAKTQFKEVAGMDVSFRELLKAKDRLRVDRMPQRQRDRLKLFQGSLTYRDKRLVGYDAAAVVEVIEHLDLNRLKAFERALFAFARPKMVVLTTPNKEYNAVFERMDSHAMRHHDHRFEWTRAEFEAWGNAIADQHNYRVAFFPIGDEVESLGAPSQMAVFNYGN